MSIATYLHDTNKIEYKRETNFEEFHNRFKQLIVEGKKTPDMNNKSLNGISFDAADIKLTAVNYINTKLDNNKTVFERIINK